MIDIYAASREWKKDGVWVIAPDGLSWIKEGARARIGEGASIGEGMKPVWPSASSSWVMRLLALCDSGTTEAVLKEISLATTDFKASGKFQQLNEDLISLDWTKLPDIVQIGLLRNTYSVRKHIAIWSTLLNRTERNLAGQSKSPSALLRGLLGH